MNKAATKKTDIHPLLERPIPHAYALVPCEGRPGMFYAVHLTQVVAEGLDVLEPSGRAEPATYGLIRLGRQQERRHQEKQWTK